MNKTRPLTLDRKLTIGILAIMTAFIFTLAAGLNVHAAEGIQIYTDTPGVCVNPGDTVSFPLYLDGSTGSDVALAIEDLPDGFTGLIKSSSYEVTKVHEGSDPDTSVATAQIIVPDDAADGTYEAVITAAADDGGTASQTLEITVNSLESGISAFQIDYPEQEGASGSTFSFNATITNNTLEAQTYNLTTNAPEGWTVSFTSDSTQVSSVNVDAGSSSNITISVAAPDAAEAKEYDITCSATSSGDKLTSDLSVTLQGSYDMTVSTKDETLSLDAYANKNSDVDLVITNNGNMDLSNVKLSAQAPTDWTVSFDQDSIDSLAAGESANVTAHIRPASDSITGDYVTYITATSDNQSDTAQFRITVKTQTGWGIFAVVIILAVIAALYMVVKKYGRR